jgi:hypothetical protein
MSNIDISKIKSIAMLPDPKGFFLTENLMKDLGLNNNLAFTIMME